ncbi:hypothetical protein DE146DRAFT_778664 [Phaeosphaeria sp. MPI-PUGE-AT-0046c]|nr:hypothetical protein DE146DRAFT_778664 [Phaeosphaeria sp. MPI-PUGE-AT-0046c]
MSATTSNSAVQMESLSARVRAIQAKVQSQQDRLESQLPLGLLSAFSAPERAHVPANSKEAAKARMQHASVCMACSFTIPTPYFAISTFTTRSQNGFSAMLRTTAILSFTSLPPTLPHFHQSHSDQANLSRGSPTMPSTLFDISNVYIIFTVFVTALITAIVAVVVNALERSQAERDGTTVSRTEILEAKVESQQAQIDHLEAVNELIRARLGSGFNPGNRSETMPKYRTACWRGEICMKKRCPFVHAKQREVVGEAIEARPDFVHGGAPKNEEWKRIRQARQEFVWDERMESDEEV